MLDFKTMYREQDSGQFFVEDTEGRVVEIGEMFPQDEWDSPEAFAMAGIKGYEPMTAKELETEEVQDEKFNDNNYIIEEKFDGTRALLYFLTQETESGGEVGYCRMFSRRVSKKTGFYVENTDSVPHLREIDAPDLGGTILDGEVFIDGLPFREVASTLNCLWDKAIERQLDKGFVTFHAFDILFYRGIDLRRFTLERRKHYLHIVLEELGNDYVKEVPYHKCGSECNLEDVYTEATRHGVTDFEYEVFEQQIEDDKDTYPHLYECWQKHIDLTPRAYYEMIVSLGGEGVMVKPLDGKYLHKRGWEYSKIKKFLTRELIVIGFSEPTKEYTGKDRKKWAYWIENDTNKKLLGNFYGDSRYTPVTKNYYYGNVGNLLLGVIITNEDYEKIAPNKRGEIYETYEDGTHLMLVCESSGFDDETREYFTKNKAKVEGTVVEVKANEIFRDSGKLRHPRYLRMRFDKSAEECTWENHIM